jgi:hypothetical protein
VSIRQRNIALVPICHLGFVPTKGPASLPEIPIMVTCKYIIILLYVLHMSSLVGIPFSPHVCLYYSTKNTHSMFECACKTGYVGDRCQYVGSIPVNWPEVDYGYSSSYTATPINSSSSSNAGAIVLLVVLLLAMISLIGGVICYLCRTAKQQESQSNTPNLEDLTMEVGDDVIAANVAGEASLPHPDEIKSNTGALPPPPMNRAEVKVTENEEDEGEDATNEII